MSAYWLYTLLLPSKQERDAFKDFMTEHDIQVSQVHKRNDEYTVFKQFAEQSLNDVTLDGLDYFADRMICIPVHWGLSISELDRVAGVCNEFAQSRSKS